MKLSEYLCLPQMCGVCRFYSKKPRTQGLCNKKKIKMEYGETCDKWDMDTHEAVKLVGRRCGKTIFNNLLIEEGEQDAK